MLPVETGFSVAFTDADLTNIRTAMLRGELTVEFADRRVTYRSIEELKAVEARILSELTSVRTRSKQTVAVASKGL